MFKRLVKSFDFRAFAAAVSVTGYIACQRNNPTECLQEQVFRKAEVQQEARENKKVWVTYKDGVYDLTNFVKKHPGGSDKLLMAMGGPIEPFWQQYPFHKVDNVVSILEQYRVGSLHPDDVLLEKDLPDFSDLQTQHLGRSDKLRVLSKFPFCAETAEDWLYDHFYTDNKMHFERNHNLIPEIDVEDYELQLMPKGRNDQHPISLTLQDLKQMPQHTLVAYICCAGNKRRYLQEVFPEVKGLKWTNGAIGNSKYKGVSMRYILLEKMGFKEQDLKGKHLIAFSYDADFQGKHYEVSVPCEFALDPLNEVMLAYEMNGEPLPKEHGFPIRMISPGCIAVRSAKWVHQLIISDEQADSAPQRRDYKIVKETDIGKVKWDDYQSVNYKPVDSGVGFPHEKQSLSGPSVEIKGWAHGDGLAGAQATKVELSFDHGKSWVQVDQLVMEDKPAGLKVFSWTLWKYTLDTSSIRGKVSVMVRATDSKGNCQDKPLEELFNLRGILNNAPHEVEFTINN